MAMVREPVQINSKYQIMLQGKTFILYAGLLDAAHQLGLKRSDVTLLQIPSAENDYTAICRAEVETEWGIFSDVGDASAKSVGKMIVPHIIRMSSTRAKARALRDATNIGETTFEELGADGASMDDEPSVRPAVLDDSHRSMVLRAQNGLAKVHLFESDPSIFPAFIKSNAEADAFIQSAATIVRTVRNRTESIPESPSTEKTPLTEAHSASLAAAKEGLAKANLLGKFPNHSFDPKDYSEETIGKALALYQDAYRASLEEGLAKKSGKK